MTGETIREMTAHSAIEILRTHALPTIGNLIGEAVETLAFEISTLEEDRDRLDFMESAELETGNVAVGHDKYGKWWFDADYALEGPGFIGNSLREAIDSAMKASRPINQVTGEIEARRTA